MPNISNGGTHSGAQRILLSMIGWSSPTHVTSHDKAIFPNYVQWWFNINFEGINSGYPSFCLVCELCSRWGGAGKSWLYRTGTMQGSGQRSWIPELLEISHTCSPDKSDPLVSRETVFSYWQEWMSCFYLLWDTFRLPHFNHVFSTLFSPFDNFCLWVNFFFSVHADRSKMFILFLPLY